VAMTWLVGGDAVAVMVMAGRKLPRTGRVDGRWIVDGRWWYWCADGWGWWRTGCGEAAVDGVGEGG
jgi:hypothetical protein